MFQYGVKEIHNLMEELQNILQKSKIQCNKFRTPSEIQILLVAQEGYNDGLLILSPVYKTRD
jgi:hypothetical protein